MAGVSGTEVLYKRESKLGLTTLTFRKRRYLFPGVSDRDDELLSASTGDLQSRGKCVMLDVGLFCPHCAGAISARLSGSHSKLVISKALPGEHRCSEGCSVLRQIEPRAAPQQHSNQHSLSNQQGGGDGGGGGDVKKHKRQAGIAEETRVQIGFGSLDRRCGCKSPAQHRITNKLSSSDYESLDRDSHANSWSSYDNSSETFNSVVCSGSLTAPSHVDDAYCSLTSSQHSNTHNSLQKPARIGHKYSSLPHNVHLRSFEKPVTEEKLILDSMHVETSDKGEDVLVDELLSDEVIDEEYQNLMNASAAKEMLKAGRQIDDKADEFRGRLPSDEAFDSHRSEDSTSERSTSPEIFVDDILENIESEVFTGDATLPRVFALQRDGSLRKHHSKRRHRHQNLQAANNNKRIPTQTKKYRSKTKNEPNPENTASLKKSQLQELVRAKYESIQKGMHNTTHDNSDFSHETFFEEVVEALTDLDGGFTTDWTSDYDSDMKYGSPSTPGSEKAKFVLGEDEGQYKELLDVYNISRKTATSSCECIADDRSRDLDSSTEQISSAVETPSEASVGEGSAEGYSSSSAYSERSENTKYDNGLFEQLIQSTKSLTEDLLVLNDDEITSNGVPLQNSEFQDHFVLPDKRRSPSVDGAKSEGSLTNSFKKRSANKVSVPVDIIRQVHPIPKIKTIDNELQKPQIHISEASEQTQHPLEHTDNELDDGIDELDTSLENLLVCNAVHCSTSDLDEPYHAELKYISELSEDQSHESDEEMKFLSELQKRMRTKTTEIDEFVPETSEPQGEVLKQTFDAPQCEGMILESGSTAKSHVPSKPINDTRSDTQTAPPSDRGEVIQREKGTLAGMETGGSHDIVATKDFKKYLQSQTCRTYHSKDHKLRLDTCLDDICQTCDFQPKGPNEIIKNEEVITQEVTLVFAWPKKMNIGRELTPPLPVSKPKQPFRTIHLRRVMKVSDFDVDAVEGPTVETVEYRSDGTKRKSIVQHPEDKQVTKERQSAENEEQKCEESRSTISQSEVVFQEKHHGVFSDAEHTAVGPKDKTGVDEGCSVHGMMHMDNEHEVHSLAEEEQSHYDATRQSFVMPSLDMTATQRSEELFNLSSSTSMELLSETECSVSEMYSDHQKTIDAIYQQAADDSCNDEMTDDKTDVVVLEDVADVAQPTKQVTDGEHSAGRETTSEVTNVDTAWKQEGNRETGDRPGKDPNVTFIEQNKRNIYVVTLGKYFGETSDLSRTISMSDDSFSNDGSGSSSSQETVCPRCSEVYVVDGNVEQTSSTPTETEHLTTSKRRGHPMPCLRCLQLEREIRIKLAELTELVEELGKRKSLCETEGSSGPLSVDDLERLSKETVENIKMLQRSIAALNDAPEKRILHEAGPDVLPGRGAVAGNGEITGTTFSPVAPGGYSTKVIKKSKAKKVSELRKIFQKQPVQTESKQEDVCSPQGVCLHDSDSIMSSVSSTSVAKSEEYLTNNNRSESSHFTHPPCLRRGDAENELTTNSVTDNTRHGVSLNGKMSEVSVSPSANKDSMSPQDYKTKLDVFAENLAKYIIFRAKLFIVLENPATRIPCLKNELVHPGGKGEDKTDGVDCVQPDQADINGC